MKIGTKSILFGAHCWFVHPWFVALAWWKLYGFPWDPRLWVCFWVHDLGYWGKPNMDGPEGETHPEWGAGLVGKWFGPYWRWFCLYHSRFYCRRDGAQFSALCVADKFSICLTPWWLYIPMVRLTGEWREYMDQARTGKYVGMNLNGSQGIRVWYNDVQTYLRRWVAEHRDLRPDTWTPVNHEKDAPECIVSVANAADPTMTPNS